MEAIEKASKITGIAKTEPTENSIAPITIADLPPLLQAAVSNTNWKKLMPVQSKAIPYILDGQDVMVQSRTGSGKTGGFILPTLVDIDPTRATCQALVLVPTRELAKQVADEAALLCQGTDIQVVTVYGGVSYGPQRAAFQRGAHLVVGTPGRVLDHLNGGSFSLDDIKMLIFDEADRMLSVGFYPDMKAVQRHLPEARRVHTIMFSATFPPHVIRLANEFLHEPAVLSLSSDHVHVTDVQHITYQLSGKDHKDDVLSRLIEIENPHSAIIFCNTKVKVNYVSTVLRRYGFNADQLSGDLSQGAREKVLDKVRAGQLRFLIATDVAARGIDIADLSHVIQYDVPQHPETYIHRAGRTGRAGASGTAIMLVELLDQINLGRINKEYEIVMQNLAPPAEETTFEVIEQRARTVIRAKYRQLNTNTQKMLNQYEEMVELLTMDEDGLRALSMLIDDFYQAEVHSGRKSSNGRKNIKPDSITNTVMADIAGELTEKMQTRDKLQFDRMIRFEPLAESLSMSGLGFNALTMLVHEFHQGMVQSQPSSNENKGGNRRKSSNNRNNGRNRNRRGRGGDSQSNRRGRGGRSSSSRSSGGGRGNRNNSGNSNNRR